MGSKRNIILRRGKWWGRAYLDYVGRQPRRIWGLVYDLRGWNLHFRAQILPFSRRILLKLLLSFPFTSLGAGPTSRNIERGESTSLTVPLFNIYNFNLSLLGDLRRWIRTWRAIACSLIGSVFLAPFKIKMLIWRNIPNVCSGLIYFLPVDPEILLLSP